MEFGLDKSQEMIQLQLMCCTPLIFIHFNFGVSRESREVLEQASRVFKSIFKQQNYKVNYSLNTRSSWWGVGLLE